MSEVIRLESISKGPCELPLQGTSVDYYPLIYIALIAILGGLCPVASRALSKG